MHKILTALLVLPLAVMAQSSDANDVETVLFRAKAAMEAGDYTNAQTLFERALRQRGETFGESSAAYAAALVDVARAYQATQKRSADAVALYRQALPIQEATLGPDHPDVAATLYYLALDAHSRKQRDVAMPLYQRALEIRTKAFGTSDPRLAELLTPMGMLSGEESLYQRALAIHDASGKATPEGATTLEVYANFLRAHDRAREADSMQARAKEIRTGRVAQMGARRGPAPGGKAYRVNAGGGITAPSVKQKIEPKYTDLARLEKLQGSVVLSIVIGTDGLAHDIQLTRGIGLGLDESAAEAIGNWVFNPGTKGGQPVPVAATVEVNFRLL